MKSFQESIRNRSSSHLHHRHHYHISPLGLVVLFIQMLVGESIRRGEFDNYYYNQNSGHWSYFNSRPINKEKYEDSDILSPNAVKLPWNSRSRAFEQQRPEKSSTNQQNREIKTDEHGRVKMGESSDYCDNGKSNLTKDWDNSPINYTCFHPETRFPYDPYKKPTLECFDLPQSYMVGTVFFVHGRLPEHQNKRSIRVLGQSEALYDLPNHFCMDKHIIYGENIPSYGDHRPLWPKYGEYLFVPTQRWLHNIEHGAVVFLYHPCAYETEVDQVKHILRTCYGKHIITPSTLVTTNRPLVLVAWGCKLSLAVAEEKIIVDFIKTKSMKGPEGNYTKEGQYDYGLIRLANETKTAKYDKITC